MPFVKLMSRVSVAFMFVSYLVVIVSLLSSGGGLSSGVMVVLVWWRSPPFLYQSRTCLPRSLRSLMSCCFCSSVAVSMLMLNSVRRRVTSFGRGAIWLAKSILRRAEMSTLSRLVCWYMALGWVGWVGVVL